MFAGLSTCWCTRTVTMGSLLCTKVLGDGLKKSAIFYCILHYKNDSEKCKSAKFHCQVYYVGHSENILCVYFIISLAKKSVCSCNRR
jgi:hypothetical protein